MKRSLIFNIFSSPCWKAVVLFYFLPSFSFSQISKVDFPKQRLLLQLGAGYLNVARQNQIDIDSGLALASTRSHLNRMLVIGENFEDIILDPANKWVADEDIKAAKKLSMSNKGSRRIQYLNIIGSFYAFQPAARKNDLDSALSYLTKAKHEAEINGDEKSLCQTLCYMGKCYLEDGKLQLADTIFNLAIKRSVKLLDKRLEAMAWAYWGTYSPFQPNTIIERITRIRKANALYDYLDDKENQIITLTNIGYLSFAAGKVAESKQSFTRGLAIENSIGFPFTHYTADLIAVIGLISGDHESQLKYTMSAVETAQTSKDSIALAFLYANRANADIKYANLKDGFIWGNKSLAEFKRLGGDPAMYFLANAMADELVRLNRNQEAIELIQDLLAKYPAVNPIDKQNAFLCLGAAYEMNNFKRAEKYYLAAENIQKETLPIRGNLGALHLYHCIGYFYFHNGQYEKSRPYLNKALTFFNSNETGAVFPLIHRYLATIDSASGHFEDAYNHAIKFMAVNDSIKFTAGSKLVSELRVKYETKNKADSINLLNQQAAMQNAQIRQEKFTKKVMLAGAALLVLFLVLLYNRYWLKQRSNKLLAIKQNEITQKNASLQNLVEQKEWLLKEVHHRVKNNLQIVISLLNTQSNYLESEAAVKAIRESQERMNAISLIHQKLYKSEDTAFINIREYVHELVEHIRKGFSGSSAIVFDLNISDAQMDVAQAVPVGLILNEAISNAIKYAFPGNSSGLISISITQSDTNDAYLLTLADNGVGLPPDYDISKKSSLGMRLMQGLTKQLGGSFNIESNNGVQIKVAFINSNLVKMMLPGKKYA